MQPVGRRQRWIPRGPITSRRLLAGAATLTLALLTGAPAAVAAPGDIFTVAGTTLGFSGDSGTATAAQLNTPYGVGVTADGGYLIADANNDRIRKVSPAGTIGTVAGTAPGLSGDGGPATSAKIENPQALAVTADGGYLIADTYNNRIRKVSAAGTITTVAGTTGGFSGDTGPAIAAQIDGPRGLALTADGGYLIADANNQRIRKVSAAGIITTVAGTTYGFSGDSGPATAAQLGFPEGLAVTADGGFLIADSENNRIRKVSAAGIITTVAGTTAGFSGDNGPATAAQLTLPYGVALTADGGYLIADTYNNRIRKVSAAGTITTVAGTTEGLSGDNGPATTAQLKDPFGVAVTANGGYVIADTNNNRVRLVSGTPPAVRRGPSLSPRIFSAPSISFAGSPTSIRVSKTGRFSYPFQSSPSAAGKVAFTTTKRVKIGSKHHTLKLTTKTFTAPTTGKVTVKLKLSHTNLKALKHAKHLRFKISATLTLAPKPFTTTVTLKAPKKH